MPNFRQKRHDMCLTILTCMCLGNIFLYIGFTNLQTEYIRRKNLDMHGVDLQAEYIRRKSQIAHGMSNTHNSTHNKYETDIRQHTYVINHPLVCDENVDLIIVVCSSLDHFRQRQAIRETWGKLSQYKINIKMIFLVGVWKQRKFLKINDTFWTEQLKYKDIVQGNFIDSYLNLTLKSVHMLHWVKNYCNNAKYLLKTDDDMYINIPNLFLALNKQVLTKFMMGHLIIGAHPVQDKTSKWYTPKSTYSAEHYPPYLSGTAYVISVSAISELYNATSILPQFWLEDVFITGICANMLGIYHIHRNDMTLNSPTPPSCKLKSLISGHKVTWRNMRSVHQIVVNETKGVCDQFE